MRKQLALALVLVVLAFAAFAAAQAQQPQPAVPQTQVPLGSKISNVQFQTVAGETVELYTYAGKQGTLLIFVATKCPISNDYNQRMADLAREYTAKGFAVVGINPNRTEPADEVARHATENALGFTVLKDPDNRVADYLGASVTPEAFLFDTGWVLRYHGRIDDSRNPANISSTDLRVALDAMAAGKPIEIAETKAFGCTIKRVPRS